MTRRPELVGLVVGVGLTAGSALVAARGRLLSWEQPLFDVVNDAALPIAAVWLVMQLGNVLAVAVAAGLALVLRRRGLALRLAAAGVSAYLLARVLKVLVDRGRPVELLVDVHLRAGEDAGRGFPSGHAAVAVALACAALPHLGRRARWAALAAAALVCLARVHVGAHLPLDVIGGAALGAACAAAVWLRREREVSRPPQRADGEHGGGAGGGGAGGGGGEYDRRPRTAPPLGP